jgi:hypothetical protein
MPPFNKNTGGDKAPDAFSQECHGDGCGRLRVHVRGVMVCAICDAYKSWPDFQPGGRK